MHRLLLVLVLFMVAGCANAWKTAYVGGAVAADFVTDVHKEAWSDPLNARAVECEAKLDPEEHSAADFDVCLGDFAYNEKVRAGLERYNAAAEVLAQVLLATDPENPNKAQLLTAWGGVYQAAVDLVRMFPEGAKYEKQLRTLTRGL